MGLLDGRVAIVTGAGRRDRPGARARASPPTARAVVVNDFGVSPPDGRRPAGAVAADEVVDEISSAGGEPSPTAPTSPTSSRPPAMVQQAIDDLRRPRRPGQQRRLRPRPDARQHQRGGVGRRHPRAPQGALRAAAARRRLLARRGQGGHVRDARIINTSSGAGLQGSVGQATTPPPRPASPALTLVAAAEMGRYGVTVNAIAPVGPHPDDRDGLRRHDGRARHGFDAMAPENNSPLVAWLASEESGDVTGRVIEVEGGIIRAAEGWAARSRGRQGCAVGARRTRTRRQKSVGAGPPAGPGLRGLTTARTSLQSDARRRMPL